LTPGGSSAAHIYTQTIHKIQKRNITIKKLYIHININSHNEIKDTKTVWCLLNYATILKVHTVLS
jgi:hypothetical protein